MPHASNAAQNAGPNSLNKISSELNDNGKDPSSKLKLSNNKINVNKIYTWFQNLK